MNLNEAFNSFLKYRSSFCAKDTLENYHYSFVKFGEFCRYYFDKNIECIDIQQIDYMVLSEYQSWLRDYKSVITNKLLSVRTVVTYMTDCRTLFNYLFDFELIGSNPAKKIRIIKKDVRSINPLTKDEANIIDSSFNLDSLWGTRNYILFHLFLDCGLRRAEVINLKWTDINLSEHYMVVFGKGRKERYVSIPVWLCETLSVFHMNIKYDHESEYVLYMINKQPLSYDSIKDIFARIIKKTKIERLHAHFLRHTFATSFIVYGGDSIMLRELLGHYDISMTQVYVHEAQKIKIVHYPIYKIDDIFLRL